jgi:hypothetical protein
MKRGSVYLALAAVVALTIACDSNKSGSPTAPTTPTPAPGVGVRAIVVGSAAASASTIQMTAKADLMDGTTQDVTRSAQWTVSDTSLAAISPGGMLTVLHSGHVDVSATYQSVSGTLGMTLSAPQPTQPTTFALSGVAQETPPTTRPLEGVKITIIQGPDTGKSTTSDSFGMFRLSQLQPGVIGAEAVKDGYFVWRLTNLTIERDQDVSVLLYPTPPKDASGAYATARCNDASWSWAMTRAEACTQNGGIAYVVCPGPMCQTTTTK